MPKRQSSELFDHAEQFVSLKESIKQSTKQLKEHEPLLREAVGAAPKDENLKQEVVVSSGSDTYVIQNTARRSFTLNVNAVEVMRKHLDKKVCDRLIQKVEVVDTDLLKTLIANDEIPQSVAKKLFSEDITYAMNVKKST